jgi:phospholipid/cholesterol/gamma-HCH transport system permease protein
MDPTPALRLKTLAATPVEALGRRIQKMGAEIAAFWHFVREIAKWTVRPPFRVALLFQQLEFIGNQSLNIILISGLAVGAVFGLQIGAIFSIFRAESLMGYVTAEALCRELAPLMTAILITGRAGSAMTAEIATMKVNEQVDAMEAMAVDPISYLVVPRVLASLVMVPMLCAIFIFIGIIGAYIAGVALFNVDQGLFVEKIVSIMEPKALVRGIIKAFAFSVIMAALACRYGLKASGGAKGVGIATTNSVVTTLLSVLFVDVVVTYFQVIW